jgi:PBP1b-binding outer membrane lipoprotein LpoB
MNKMKSINLALTLILFFLIVSCGYQVGFDNAQNPSVQLKIEKIYIKPLKNKSSEMMLSVWVTEEIRNEFLRNGGIIVSTYEEADFVLEGEIKSLDTSGISFVRYDQTVERRINAGFFMKLTDRKTGKIAWKEENMRREESFFVGREIMETEGLKDDALRRLSLYIAQNIYHKITGRY